MSGSFEDRSLTKEWQLTVEISSTRHFQAGRLTVEIYPDSKAAGLAAAEAAARAFRALGETSDAFGVIFATGASQIDTLDALTRIPNLPWQKIRGFHMDEYVGVPIEHPASFRRYLRERLTSKVRMGEFHEIDGTAPNPEETGRQYAEMLRAAAPQVCLLGIGENGHLAFNDPDVADFADPVDVKTIVLDPVCRQQQYAEGWFPSVDDVAESAITLTIPALLRVPKLIVSVPGSRKAAIMRRTVEEEISTACPATILRTHPDATVYLDAKSAAELDGLGFSR
jgi:glucosamine-6-phosphate deaminase